MRELWLERPREPRLRYALVEPPDGAPTCRSAVFLTPGFGEHIGRYAEIARKWAELGFLVALHDPRGQGRSEGRRGHVTRFDEYVDDALALLAALEAETEWRRAARPFLFGHSLGGLISCHLALRAPSRFTGLALSSPYFGRALQVSPLRIWAGKSVGRVWPTYSDRTRIQSSQLTHDVDRAKAIDADPLMVPKITARWFVEVEEAQSRLEAAASSLTLPIFCQAAGDDSVADLEATKRVMSRFASTTKELCIREDAFHTLHEEVRRDDYMAAFASWFEGVGSAAAAN